jgi:hypothetical protein
MLDMAGPLCWNQIGLVAGFTGIHPASDLGHELIKGIPIFGEQ